MKLINKLLAVTAISVSIMPSEIGRASCRERV